MKTYDRNYAEQMFQSAPLREGRRAEFEGFAADLRQVSIRAPARGATRRSDREAEGPDRFNPRPCARGDLHSSFYRCRTGRFQSAPLREGRRIV